MSKTIRWIQTYLVLGFPFVVGLMVWITIQYEKGAFSDRQVVQLHGFFWNALSFNLMAWFLILALFLVLLVFSARARELTIKRLANIRERDEREEQITG